jgi:hypothetical protein
MENFLAKTIQLTRATIQICGCMYVCTYTEWGAAVAQR